MGHRRVLSEEGGLRLDERTHVLPNQDCLGDRCEAVDVLTWVSAGDALLRGACRRGGFDADVEVRCRLLGANRGGRRGRRDLRRKRDPLAMLQCLVLASFGLPREHMAISSTIDRDFPRRGRSMPP